MSQIIGNARMRENLKPEKRDCTYDTCVSHLACDSGKLYLSSESCSCDFAVWKFDPIARKG